MNLLEGGKGEDGGERVGRGLGERGRVGGRQTYQVSRISRETHAFRPTLTLTRPRNEISRMAVNVMHINNMREIS